MHFLKAKDGIDEINEVSVGFKEIYIHGTVGEIITLVFWSLTTEN